MSAPEDIYTARPPVRITHPEWSKNATIYQINTRQFTPDGTLRSAEAHLPRLRDLGVVILWLMPVQKIGQKNRKGELGSPYAVSDYYAMEPALGSVEDLKHFVEVAHGLGMYVILDWVPNHTAWDSNLVTEHPEWYARDWKGDFIPTPWWDWDDIIDLDYDVPELRRYMTEAMVQWVRRTNIDGYRCDTAGFVPTDFWENVRDELDRIKPVFMLAEWEARDLHTAAFDMTYAWSWNEAMHRIASGKGQLEQLRVYYAWNAKSYPRDAMRMTFVSNHDKNSWEGTEYEQFGEALEAAIVLSVVGEGMPLLYNGQEAGSDKRLPFFERDPIQWQEHPMGELYRKLFTLKRENTALWNAHWAAPMIEMPTSARDSVLSFVRHNDRDKVFAIFNLSASPETVSFDQSLCHDSYVDIMTGGPVTVDGLSDFALAPWSFRVLVRPGSDTTDRPYCPSPTVS